MLRFSLAVRAKADVSGVSGSATSSRFLSWFFRSSLLLHQLASPAEYTKPANSSVLIGFNSLSPFYAVSVFFRFLTAKKLRYGMFLEFVGFYRFF